MELELNGVLSSEEYTPEQLEDMFLTWCEENNISFGGAFYEDGDGQDDSLFSAKLTKCKYPSINDNYKKIKSTLKRLYVDLHFEMGRSIMYDVSVQSHKEIDNFKIIGKNIERFLIDLNEIINDEI